MPSNPFGPFVFAAAALLLSACATEIRDDMPGRAQSPGPALSGPIRTETYTPGVTAAAPVGERRLWSESQGSGQTSRPRQPQAQQPETRPQAKAPDNRTDDDEKQPPPRRRGSSSPPPGQLIAPPQTVPLPSPPSTQSATDAFKRDLIRPDVDRMRTDDAMGKLDPLQQRDLMRRENDLRQWGGDPLRR